MVLSEKDAEEIVESLLPMIKKEIEKSEFGNVDIKLQDIGSISGPVNRERNTADTYFKISEAMYDHGIATDLKVDVDQLLYRFRNITSDDKRPIPEICTAIWKEMHRSIKIKNE